jgi:glycogen operon protein
LEILAGDHHRLGAHAEPDGVNFAVFSENAERVELCIFDVAGTEIGRLDLPERSGAIWHGFVPGARPGCRYGYRVHGDYAPERGHRFNPNKLLVDPYARQWAGSFGRHAALYGYRRGGAEEDLSFDTRDSAPFMPKGVVTAPPGGDAAPRRPCIPWSDAILYEAHVKGLTKQLSAVDGPVRGTYDALAHPAVIDHLSGLGVTTVELLPVQAFLDEPFLGERGLTNYWGYSPIGFHALDPRYLGPGGPEGFRAAVRRLHDAGLEVVLDVVYNHTGEGDHTGQTVSFRGLDNAAYYRLQPGRPRFHIDETGCGNTLNTTHPMVQRLVLDSLRYWTEAMEVDGFRFDLATTLGREEDGFDAGAGLLDAMIQDPVLSRLKLIAEPWDVGPGGYRLGGFPFPFAEWNDKFRDDARRFWRGDDHGAHGLAARLLGSAELFDRAGRRAWTSVNFITAHDGFTLSDVVSYNEKHNGANGEQGRDGHHVNFSDNCGVEGPSADPAIVERRARRRRNLMATLLLAQGTPMILAGDEIGNSQGGNNNAYCQDNETGWIDWSAADAGMLSFTRRLTALRKAHPALRQSRFLHGRIRADDGHPDAEWRTFEGGEVNWRDPSLEEFCLLLRGSAEAPACSSVDDAVLLVFNGARKTQTLRLPPGPGWRRSLDTVDPDAEPRDSDAVEPIAPRSIVVFTRAGPGG